MRRSRSLASWRARGALHGRRHRRQYRTAGADLGEPSNAEGIDQDRGRVEPNVSRDPLLQSRENRIGKLRRINRISRILEEGGLRG